MLRRFWWFWDDSNAPHELIFWDLATRDSLHIPYAAAINSVSFSPDGNTVAVGSSKVELWDVASRKWRRTLANVTATVAFSPSGRSLAIAQNDGDIRLFDLDSRQIAHRFRSPSGHPFCIAFSPDGKRLAEANYMGVQLWNVATEGLAITLKGHDTFCVELAFSHDGRLLATASLDHTARLWRAPREPLGL
jgi:WD40 repeat protein